MTDAPRSLASTADGGKGGTLLQKRKEVRFEFPATIPVPYEPPGSGISGNINLKKIYREVYFYCSSYIKI